MKIDHVLIQPDVVEKILFKHGVRPKEVEDILKQVNEKTYFEKVKQNRFIAIGISPRGYITVFFDRTGSVVEVVSARFCTSSEKRKYKKKMG